MKSRIWSLFFRSECPPNPDIDKEERAVTELMFGRGIRLFSILGFEVKLDWSWLILAVLIAWSLAAGYFPTSYPEMSTVTYVLMGVAGALGLFASVVFHELSHSLVARQYGIPMHGITLFIFGGVAQMSEEAKSARSEFLMAIAGPIASVIIAGVFFAIGLINAFDIWPQAITAVLNYLALINLLLAAFNMIPAFPLDGGRVLRAALWKWKEDLGWATRITSQIGSGFGLLLIALGAVSFLFGAFINGIWLVLLGLFLRHLAQNAFQTMMINQSLEGVPIRKFARTDSPTVSPSLSVRDLVDNYIFDRYERFFPIVQDSRLEGCVTVENVKRIREEEWDDHTVKDIAHGCSEDNTIEADESATKALTRMSRGGDRRLMVVDNDRLVGVVTMRDIMEYLSVKSELQGSG